MTNQIEPEFPACSLCHSERGETSFGQFGEQKTLRRRDLPSVLCSRLTERAMAAALYGKVSYE